MDPEFSRRMFEEGGILVLIGMPPGTEFGIDLNVWRIGDKFMGVKLIPPGLHFVYFSAVGREGDVAPRTGFFHNFNHGELLVREYDASAEDLKAEDDGCERVQRLKENIRNLDRNLGPYPLESWQKWVSLTQYISSSEIERLQPLSGRICSAPELVVQEETSDPLLPAFRDRDPTAHLLPDLVPKPGTELRLTGFPRKSYPDGASPSQVTKYSMDSSFAVEQMIKSIERPLCLISELQFAFVCFLVGQVCEGWEHWRQLVGTLCKAEEILVSHPELYSQLLSVLHFQIHEVPPDLFVDIVESDNFLASYLATLFANINDNAHQLPRELTIKAGKFRAHLTDKFRWCLSTGGDEGDNAPVLVQTEEVESLSPMQAVRGEPLPPAS